MDLSDGAKTEYRLFDSMRMRFVPGIRPVEMTPERAKAANGEFARAACPHLEWKSQTEQNARRYTIKR